MKICLVVDEPAIKTDPEFLKMTEDLYGFGSEFVSNPNEADLVLVMDNPKPKIAFIGNWKPEQYSNIKNFMWHNFFF